MPYAEDFCGVYKIINTQSNLCYVGQSQRVKKRIADHFKLLRMNKHGNQRLQNAFNKYGEENFKWNLEVICEDLEDMDAIENAFISGEAVFVEPVFYNIAPFSKSPMRGKSHSEEVRKRISEGRSKTKFDYASAEYRKKLKDITLARVFSDQKYVEKVKFILEHPEMTYAARAKEVGSDTSTVRKIALKYAHLKGTI